MSIELDLPSLREDAALSVDELLSGISSQMDQALLLSRTRALCRDFHMIGVATLLLDGEPQFFFLNLCRAAENWRQLLEHHASRGWGLPPASENVHLLGAMAAGQWNLARQVAERSSTVWQPSEEYEEDFAWACFMHHLAGGEVVRTPRLEEALARLEAVAGEAYESRHALGRSLLSSDEHGFLEGFAAMVEAHEEQVELRASAFGTPVESFAPYRYIWFEGLALLRLAERVGFSVGDYYTYCPPIARVPMTEVYAGDWTISLA